VTGLEFFENLPDVIKGFFSSFFVDIKSILDKIDPTEKLNSIGSTLKGFASDTVDKAKKVVGDAGDFVGDLADKIFSENKIH
jgi:hypothetical protein